MEKTNLVNKIKNFFASAERGVYFVTEGSYKGEWLVKVRDIPGHTVFFSLPDKFERIVPAKDLSWALENKLLELVDTLPSKVYNVCIAEYEHAKRTNTLNRREQHSAPRTLDRKKYKDALNELQRSRNRDTFHILKDAKDERDDV